MDIKDLRAQIDGIDEELLRLFAKRMGISAQVADYKKANHLPIFDPLREQQILDCLSEKAGPELAEYARALYSTIFALSRSYQERRSEEAP